MSIYYVFVLCVMRDVYALCDVRDVSAAEVIRSPPVWWNFAVCGGATFSYLQRRVKSMFPAVLNPTLRSIPDVDVCRIPLDPS